MKDYAFIISKEEKEMAKQVEKIVKEQSTCKPCDLRKVQQARREKLELIFQE